MNLTPELHQEIAGYLADSINKTLIIARLAIKQIVPADAERLIAEVEQFNAEALALSAAPVVQSNVVNTLPFATATMPVTVPKAIVSEENIIIAKDVKIRVLMRMTGKPHVALFENVLSNEECDALIAASEVKLKQSTVVSNKDGSSEVDPVRSSSGTYFSLGEPLVKELEERLAILAGWPVTSGENIQVMRYNEGEEYKPHFDYFDPTIAGSKSHIVNGNRVATMIVYLSDVAAGGSTVFPAINLHIVPKKGTALFFSYDTPTAASMSLHGGSPVVRGQKWIATKWMREIKK